MIAETMAISHSTPIGNLFSHGRQVHTFESDTALGEVLHHFSTYAVDTVIIVDQTLSIGILTLKDMIRAVHDCNNLSRPVKEFMTAPLHVFHSHMSIADVLDAMNHALYEKIVVTHDADGVVGVIDKRHLLALCYTQLTPLIKHEYHMLHSLMGLVEEGEQGLLKLATTDTLTGIGNRRLLEEVFQAHQKVDERYGVTMFLVMLDIDDFKIINDTYGHNIGDSVLKELTVLVSRSIRKSDLFIRWGGEEFAILLRYSDPAMAVKVAEQIRIRIARHTFKTVSHLTCSFGLTLIKPHDTLEAVIERADRGLYRAKAEGKNSVRIGNL